MWGEALDTFPCKYHNPHSAFTSSGEKYEYLHIFLFGIKRSLFLYITPTAITTTPTNKELGGGGTLDNSTLNMKVKQYDFWGRGGIKCRNQCYIHPSTVQPFPLEAQFSSAARFLSQPL